MPRSLGRRARRALALAHFAAAGAALATPAGAQCVVVQARSGARYVPHLALHFGAPADVERRLQCTTAVDKNAGDLCVPIYAYDLWEGAGTFEFALETPRAPLGFQPGPEIVRYSMSVEDDGDGSGATTSLRLESARALCGPAFLGCLRLQAADLPDAFDLPVGMHRDSRRRAVRTAGGEWRDLYVEAGGAHIGADKTCPVTACDVHLAIDALRAAPGELAGLVDLMWEPGSAPFTLLRYRTDGRYPADPWDGAFLAFVPSTTTRTTLFVPDSGELRITAWSVTRGPFGQLLDVSSVECGSLASVLVHLPVDVVARPWAQVKALYR